MPFRHQGRAPTGKTDCAGVICHVAARNNVPHDDQSDYPRMPGGSRLEAALDGQDYLVRVPVSQIQAGDVLLMKFTGDPQHLGLFTGENIIHAYESVGKVVEHGLTAEWKRRIVRAYRFVGVEA
jgi:cell wall-associated NlpC family hydrolase